MRENRWFNITLLITMATKMGIFMIADSLEVEDIKGGVSPVKTIEKLDRIAYLNVVLSFWGTIKNKVKDFNLIEELGHFKDNLKEDDNALTISEKIKKYFEKLAILDDDDNLGFHICGYIGKKAYIHHVHHIIGFEKNSFKNEDSTQEYQGRERFIEYPILFNGENKIPNLFVNMIKIFNDQIVYKEFTREQAKDFLIFLMETAIKLQNFSDNSLYFGKLIGYPLRFCEITTDNIYIEEIKNPNSNIFSN